MSVRMNTYLTFRDETRAAMEFYRSVFGGELSLNTFAELHASEDPAEADKIMHAMLETEDGLALMAADLPNSMEHTPPAGFAISLSGDDEKRLRGYWEAISDGGQIQMPLEQAPWGDTFGHCTDRFGINWMVNISPASG